MAHKLILKLFDKHPWVLRIGMVILLVLQINLVFLKGYEMMDCTWVAAFAPTIFIAGYIFAFINDILIDDVFNDNKCKTIAFILNVFVFIAFPIIMIVLHEVGIL